MEPFSSSRSSTFSISNWAYFASRTPRATFSKSQNTARLRDSWFGTFPFRGFRLAHAGLQLFEVQVDYRRDVQGEELRHQQPAHHRDAERHARAAAGAEA